MKETNNQNKRTSKLKLRLDIPGRNIDDISWKEFKDFIDKFIDALKAIYPSANVDNILPTEIRSGSTLQAEIHTDQTVIPAFNKFKKGPTKSWTSEMDKKVIPLYDYLESQNASLYGSFRGEPKIIKFSSLKINSKEVRGESEYIVFVERIGGADPKVSIRFFNDERRTFDADEDIIKKLGNKIFDYAKVKGNGKWDYETGELISFRITEVIEWDYVPLLTILKESEGKQPVITSDMSLEELLRSRNEARSER